MRFYAAAAAHAIRRHATPQTHKETEGEMHASAASSKSLKTAPSPSIKSRCLSSRCKAAATPLLHNAAGNQKHVPLHELMAAALKFDLERVLLRSEKLKL